MGEIYKNRSNLSERITFSLIETVKDNPQEEQDDEFWPIAKSCHIAPSGY